MFCLEAEESRYLGAAADDIAVSNDSNPHAASSGKQGNDGLHALPYAETNQKTKIF